MLTNMESANSGLSGIGKVLTTPFSINDILTRNHAERRLSRSESELELTAVNIRAEEQNLKNFMQYKSQRCTERLSNNNSPTDPRSRSSDFRSSFYHAMDNNNQGDYMAHKLGYFSAAAAAAALANGRPDCPIDMRRCSANDSGNYLKMFERN